MLNFITVAGRLVADPELRRTGSGVAVTNFTLAVDRDFGKNENGEKETDFIPVVCWRNTAEFAQKYFSRGRMAIVAGRLQIRKYTDKDGNKRSVAEIVAENIYFGDSKNSNEGNSFGNPGNYAAPAMPVSDFAMLDDDDASLPF